MMYPLQDKEANGKYLGDYAVISKDTELTDAEHLYRLVWEPAKNFCEVFGISPTRVQMIVKLMRCEKEKNESLGIHFGVPDDADVIMTIGWKIWITNEEISGLGDKAEKLFAQE